jgi:hypothetical protein
MEPLHDITEVTHPEEPNSIARRPTAGSRELQLSLNTDLAEGHVAEGYGSPSGCQFPKAPDDSRLSTYLPVLRRVVLV